MEKYIRFKAIETNVLQAGATKVFFPDQPDLRNAKVVSIVTYDSNDLSASPQTGNTIITRALLKSSSLIVFEGSNRKIDHLPLIDLHETTNDDAGDNFTRHQKHFLKLTPSWDKCYIESTTAFDGGGVYVIGVYYVLPEDLV